MPGGTRSYEMARRLVSMGHEVNLVTSWREPHSSTDWFTSYESGITVHWLPVPYSNHLSYKKRMLAFLKFAWGAARKAASLPADVIFATSTPLTIALPGVYAARLQKVPFVFEVRDLWPELPIAMGALRNPVARGAAKLLEQFAYRSSAEIVTLSPGMTEGVLATGISSARVTEIPNSSDLDLFYPNPQRRESFRAQHSIGDDQILVVYTGTFGLINGAVYLPRLAAALLSDPRFYFVMVGDGLEYHNVQLEATRLGVLNKNLKMLGSIPKVHVPQILSAADIAASLFVPLSAMEANSANKFFDGLASGCCMAINYGGWQASLLSETGAGLRLHQDVSKAAQQLQDLADQPNRIAQAKISARQLAEKQFSRDHLAFRLEQVLVRAST